MAPWTFVVVVIPVQVTMCGDYLSLPDRSNVPGQGERRAGAEGHAEDYARVATCRSRRNAEPRPAGRSTTTARTSTGSSSCLTRLWSAHAQLNSGIAAEGVASASSSRERWSRWKRRPRHSGGKTSRRMTSSPSSPRSARRTGFRAAAVALQARRGLEQVNAASRGGAPADRRIADQVAARLRSCARCCSKTSSRGCGRKGGRREDGRLFARAARSRVEN